VCKFFTFLNVKGNVIKKHKYAKIANYRNIMTIEMILFLYAIDSFIMNRCVSPCPLKMIQASNDASVLIERTL